MGAEIAQSLAFIRGRIAAAAARAGRSADSVSIVAVTKGQPPEAIRAAVEAGHTVFGENRVQEAKAKIPLCPGHLHWHMIGHLQSNKARDAVHFFDMVESIDSLSLAVEVNKFADKAAKTLPILLEVNVAGESSKFGYNPNTLLAQLLEINALPKLEIHGLMTVAPWSAEPEKVRPVFRKLREIKEQCEQKLGAPLPYLSMGMSGDFEVAVEEGATIVRIGTALFGPRPKLAREADGP
ncbi:MAG: YggS family pyridoxal phosphate-dependent enzyme [Verrucomicrobia subdivision 3 bacterium]|nr:YggS family pyridoxal phosphate-dependent enzyme [Limisphaerales bacterium]